MYVQNKAAPEVLENINYMLCESFARLWAQKNKELGRFSSSLLRMVEVVIDYVILPLNQGRQISRREVSANHCKAHG